MCQAFGTCVEPTQKRITKAFSATEVRYTSKECISLKLFFLMCKEIDDGYVFIVKQQREVKLLGEAAISNKTRRSLSQ